MERPPGTDAISEVVGFVIMLAVVMAGLSLYLTYAVPIQGREAEITEMDNVRAWFVDYKTGVDQLWLNSPLVPQEDSGGDPALHGATIGQVTLRRVINTGTAKETGFVRRYLPVLAPIPASAEVSVGDTGTLTISGWRNRTEVFSRTYAAPALAYTSHNNYWFQQEYYYQLGGVFLRQWDPKGGAGAEKVTVVEAPPLSIYRSEVENTDQYKVELVVVDLDASEGGFGATSPIRVETRLDQDPAKPDMEGGSAYSDVSLTFTAASQEAAEAWKNLFEGAAARNGVNNSCYNLTGPGNPNIARIYIKGSSDDPTTYGVMLELLVADCTMSLENTPTLIE